jgi:mono/diheme cytochrome c family protein
MYPNSKKYLVAIFIPMLSLSACTDRGSGVPVYTQTASTGDDQSGGVAKTTGGKEIFEQRCVACHGEYGNLRHENAANLQMSRLDSIGIVQTIQNGRNIMPPFKDAIPDSDISKLAVYVKSLRK